MLPGFDQAEVGSIEAGTYPSKEVSRPHRASVVEFHERTATTVSYVRRRTPAAELT